MADKKKHIRGQLMWNWQAGRRPRGLISSTFSVRAMDFMLDTKHYGMSPAAIGVYAVLLCLEWMEGGDGIKNDPRDYALRMDIRTSKVRKVWLEATGPFQPHPLKPDYLIHPVLQKQRERQIAPNRAREIPGIRELLVARDGECCAYCRTTVLPLQIDHFVPRHVGGTDDPENLRLACGPCNQSKGRKHGEAFELWMKRKGHK